MNQKEEVVADFVRGLGESPDVQNAWKMLGEGLYDIVMRAIKQETEECARTAELLFCGRVNNGGATRCYSGDVARAIRERK
jgi:hypothetical protein